MGDFGKKRPFGSFSPKDKGLAQWRTASIPAGILNSLRLCASDSHVGFQNAINEVQPLYGIIKIVHLIVSGNQNILKDT